MAATTSRPLSVKLDQETRVRMEQLAKARRRTTHWMMREAIQQYVDREEKREAFRQAALQAWADFQMTGLHATAEEVDAWLASWGTDHELPAPVCHK
ncbi:ribbon-helix-helix protein, CopG family [Acidithiobacillus caldus]|jgi:predicted transcriptional regulator|uniref:CopG family ribbon-helix-helix protein n=1 Tax=Acidithiobacillus caldus TaxID=33059 RepID=UPI001C06C43B|nr:CopG family ribbon-helix-helix protein [Acidithiobacillus caldus]MBU2781162.1 ribbon-helix-helix protein, CopG family [Acidithiobacillus caldus]